MMKLEVETNGLQLQFSSVDCKEKQLDSDQFYCYAAAGILSNPSRVD